MKISFRRNVALYALLAIACCSTSDIALADHDPYVRGERARLERQAYDYYYRNSNNNVFRSSRHFHPTRNPFRSSRYYKQRVAASSDGYPLRTFIRYGETIDGVRRVRSFDYTHHRRYPLGPVLTPGEYGSDPGCRNRGFAAPIDTPQYYVAPAPVAGSHQRPPRDRYEIDMHTIHIAQAEPTQRAVSETIELPDGSTKLVISSVAIEPSESALDDAWRMFADESYEQATQAFARFALDPDHGDKATLGYALSQTALGEMRAAAAAFERIDIEQANLDSSLCRADIAAFRRSIADVEDKDTNIVASALDSVASLLSDSKRTTAAPE